MPGDYGDDVEDDDLDDDSDFDMDFDDAPGLLGYDASGLPIYDGDGASDDDSDEEDDESDSDDSSEGGPGGNVTEIKDVTDGASDDDSEDDDDDGDEEEESDSDEESDEDEPPAPQPAKKQKADPAPAKEPAKKKEAPAPAKKEPPAKKKEPMTNVIETKSKAKKWPNGFEIHELKQGKASGKLAKAGSRVTMKYVGKLTNGKIFDQTKGKSTFKFRLGVGEVIKGWDRGVEGMRVGDRRKLVCPPSMAYGSSRTGPIPPNSTLVFEVELVDVR